MASPVWWRILKADYYQGTLYAFRKHVLKYFVQKCKNLEHIFVDQINVDIAN